MSNRGVSPYDPPDAERAPPAPPVVIAAHGDAEAVLTWLRAKGSRSPRTFEAYQREARRLLLWLDEQGVTLRALTVEHVHQFYGHLANPPRQWRRPRKPRRDEALRPTQVLTGPLSNSAIDYTRTVLGQLCAYLQDAGYLRGNVFRLSARPAVASPAAPTRLLDLASWRWLWTWLQHLPAATPLAAAHAARSRWVFALLYHTGIRRAEAARAGMGDFARRDRAWSLRVLGKGRQENYVTVNSALLAELTRYRRSLGLSDYPVPGESLPLVASVNGARRSTPLTPRAIGLIVAIIGRRAAAACDDDHIRAQLARMSTHWLRHTNATHRLLAGASLETTQDELGHADPRTTRRYAKVASAQRRDDAEKLAQLLTGNP